MKRKSLKTLITLAAVSTIGISAAGAQSSSTAQPSSTPAASSDDAKDALEDVNEAVAVVHKMMSQPEAAKLLRQAKGVLLVPDYGRGAFIVGGSGGEGVLVARNGGTWAGPVFYNIGAISVGPQAGATAGQIAMLLMTDKAVNSFKGNNTFSLNAQAGLTIVNWSARAQASLGKADVVLWSDTEGAFAGGSISGSDISADEEANHAYYGTSSVTPASILSGTVKPTEQRAAGQQLKNALPA